MRIGFAGLRVIGGPMCRHLVEDGRSAVTAHDLDLARVPAGAAPTPRLAGLTEGEVIFLVLPGEAEIRATVGELAAHMKAGAVPVDCSTASPGLSTEIAERLAEHGIAMGEAPIAGTAQSVQGRDITLMVGATPEVFAAIEAPLRAMARTVRHCGGLGAGITVKLLLNMVLAQEVGALAEALVTARAAGVDGTTLFEALAEGADSFALRQHGVGALLADDFPEGRFPTRYMAKDLTIWSGCALRSAWTSTASPSRADAWRPAWRRATARPIGRPSSAGFDGDGPLS